MSLALAIRLARARDMPAKLGNQRMPRMVAILSSRNVAFIGINSPRTSPLQARFADRPDRTATHAEIHCLEQAIRYFSKINHSRRIVDNLDLSGFRLSVARVLGWGGTLCWQSRAQAVSGR